MKIKDSYRKIMQKVIHIVSTTIRGNIFAKYIFIVFLLVFINIAVSNISFRLDLTKGQAYTLSPATRKIVKQIDKKVDITLFASSDLPARLLPLKTDVIDLLREYSTNGEGKINFIVMDPAKDTKAKEKAQEVGVPELRLQQIEKDKLAVSASYFGIAIAKDKNSEVIPVATDISSLEYDITSAIYKLTRKKMGKLGVIGVSQFAPDPRADLFVSLKEILSQQYEIEYLDISNDKPLKIDKALETIVVVAKNIEFTNKHAISLQNYLYSGGKIILMLDGISVSDTLVQQEATHNLFDFVASNSAIVKKNLVLSASAEMARFTAGQFTFAVPYPYWVKATNFNTDSIEFSNIRQLLFPWVSSMDIKKQEGIKANTLVSSNENSWTTTGNSIELIPDKIPQPNQKNISTQKLIIELEQKKEGRLMIIPTSRFVEEQFVNLSPDNLSYMLNVVNTYASKGALAGIQARSVEFAPLKPVSDQQRDIFKILTIIGFPALFALFGAYRMMRRR